MISFRTSVAVIAVSILSVTLFGCERREQKVTSGFVWVDSLSQLGQAQVGTPVVEPSLPGISSVAVREVTAPEVPVSESGRFVMSVKGTALLDRRIQWRSSDPNLLSFDRCDSPSGDATRVSCGFVTQALKNDQPVSVILFARYGADPEVLARVQIVPFHFGVRKTGDTKVATSVMVAPGDELELIADGAGLDSLFLGWLSSNYALISTDSCYGTGAGIKISADLTRAICRVKVSSMPIASVVQVTGAWMPSDSSLKLSRQVSIEVKQPEPTLEALEVHIASNRLQSGEPASIEAVFLRSGEKVTDAKELPAVSWSSLPASAVILAEGVNAQSVKVKTRAESRAREVMITATGGGQSKSIRLRIGANE